MAEVLLSKVTKRFAEAAAVDELTLQVADGEVLVLLGPTGAGKTTTLRLVAGIERPDAGEIRIDGRDVTREPPAVRDVAFVFQQYSLYPHLSVYDNLAFPLRAPVRRLPEGEIRARVREIAALLQIDAKLGNRATQLSGGEMQRVAIGRALVRNPSIYLMDEPLSSLDAKLRSGLRLELKRIQAEFGATILYVTHDQVEAMTLASRIGVLSAGRLVQVGTPREIYENPCNLYVAMQLGTPPINLIPPDLVPASQTPAGTHTVGARTEQLRIGALNGHGARALLRRVEHLGDQNHLHLEIGDRPLVTLADPHSPWRAGDEVSVTLDNPFYFNAAGERLAAPN
ncbi:MAG: ABC transporter ATP-binding protein [Pseudomonadota bacterium]